MAEGRLCLGIDARPLAEPPSGIRRWLEGLLGGLSALPPDHETVLFVPSESVVPPEKLKARVMVVPGSGKAVFRPGWEVFGLPGALRASGADILLSSYGVVPPRCPVPVVAVVHDLAFMKLPEVLPLKYRLYWRWMAWSVPRAAAVVVPSEATGRDVVSRLGIPAGRISVVPHGVDRLFAPASRGEIERVRREYGLPVDFVLAVGTMEPRKNLRALCLAMDRVNEGRISPVGLVLAGREGWGGEVGPRSWLHHIAGPDDETLVALFSGASVFAMPSLDEGFGLPALEAMACGAPVVVAGAGALPEVVGRSGEIVPPEDIDGWASTLNSVLNDRDRADQMRKQSLTRAGLFSWERSARTIAGVVTTVVRRESVQTGA